MEIEYTETPLHCVADVPPGQPFYVMNSEKPQEVDYRWLNIVINFEGGMYIGTGTGNPKDIAEAYVTVLDLRTSTLYLIDKKRHCVYVDAKVVVQGDSPLKGEPR